MLVGVQNGIASMLFIKKTKTINSVLAGHKLPWICVHVNASTITMYDNGRNVRGYGR